MKNQTKICKYCKTEVPSGAKICPNCKKKQGGKLKWIIIAIVAVALIGAFVGGNSDDNKSNDATNTSETDVSEENDTLSTENESEPEKEIEYTAYTVSKMMDDLEENALKAESTYKDQYVEVTGRLGTIDSSGKYITLYPEENEFAIIGVQCYIKGDEQKQKVMEMSSDDTVTLKGKITSVGEVLGYSLDIDEIKWWIKLKAIY